MNLSPVFVVDLHILFLFVLLAYEDLVVPLKKSCPEAMTTPNSAGVTPEDLLQWMKRTEVI